MSEHSSLAFSSTTMIKAPGRDAFTMITSLARLGTEFKIVLELQSNANISPTTAAGATRSRDKQNHKCKRRISGVDRGTACKSRMEEDRSDRRISRNRDERRCLCVGRWYGPKFGSVIPGWSSKTGSSSFSLLPMERCSGSERSS